MSEFVVGQWVEWRDDAVMVVDMQPRCGLIGVDINGERRWVQEENVKPFAWQVGRTYRTTLEGYTGKVLRLTEGDAVIGELQNGVAFRWNAKTGLVFGYEHLEKAAHLLPFLADEPSEPNVEAVKPQASSPYDRVIGGVEVDVEEDHDGGETRAERQDARPARGSRGARQRDREARSGRG